MKFFVLENLPPEIEESMSLIEKQVEELLTLVWGDLEITSIDWDWDIAARIWNVRFDYRLKEIEK